jgi:starch phosphorylase
LAEPGKVQSIADWRQQIADNWYRVSITDATQAPASAILMGDKVNFKARVSLGNLKPEEVQVEVFLGQRGNVGGIEKTATIPMNCTGKDGETYLYEASAAPANSGRQDYALRVLPKNDNLPNVLTPLFIRWEE